MEQLMKGQRTARLFATAGKVVAAINSGYKAVIATPNGATEVAAVVRCKDCKYRPKVIEEKDSVGVMETHYEFPEDSKCPCQNTNDQYYSWCPDDDWFCADGERAVT